MRDPIEELSAALVETLARLSTLEERVAGMVRHGTVTDVDPAKGRVRLKVGEDDDGGDFKGPWVPYSQVAGALKAHVPPSIGQQMTMICPSGDWRQAVALPMTWSNANANPGGTQDTNVITLGAVRIEFSGSKVKAAVGGSYISIEDGKVEASADVVQTLGASLKHNAKEVGDTHGHVTAPPGPPGPPV